MKTVGLSIEGMSCGGCVRRVSQVLTALVGVVVERVIVGAATVQLANPGISESQAIEALSAAGFRAKATQPSCH